MDLRSIKNSGTSIVKEKEASTPEKLQVIAEEGEKTTEVPWNVYTDDVKDSVASYGDAAIVVLSRIGGEGADLDFN